MPKYGESLPNLEMECELKVIRGEVCVSFRIGREWSRPYTLDELDVLGGIRSWRATALPPEFGPRPA